MGIENAAKSPPSSDLLEPAVIAAEDSWRPYPPKLECMGHIVVRRTPSKGWVPLEVVDRKVVGAIIHALAPTILPIEFKRAGEAVTHFTQKRVEVGVGIVSIKVHVADVRVHGDETSPHLVQVVLPREVAGRASLIAKRRDPLMTEVVLQIK